MDALLPFAAALGFFILGGIVLGWFSFFKYRQLANKVQRLETALLSLRKNQQQQQEQSVKQHPKQQTTDPTPVQPGLPGMEAPSQPPGKGLAPTLTEAAEVDDSAGWEDVHILDSQEAAPDAGSSQSGMGVDPKRHTLTTVRTNWMVWLGGICVGLAGIFLARYSIEAGLLGPVQRIIGAYATGIGLHALAQWLHYKTGSHHPAFAALAGGASITLYAATLAALHLYQILSPGTAFTILTVISLCTMLLALRDGPVSAIIGILGAYVVPILVLDDSSMNTSILIYSLMISSAALLLMRYVYRPWLWCGMLVGALGWWMLSLQTDDVDGFRGLYLTILAYAMLAIPSCDWLLKKKKEACEPGGSRKGAAMIPRDPVSVGLTLILLAHTCSILAEPFSSQAFLLWAPLYLVILLAAGSRTTLTHLPWLSLILGWFAWLYCGLDFKTNPVTLVGIGIAQEKNFLLFAIGMSLLYSGLSWWTSRGKPFSHTRCSLLVLAPVVWFALTYLLVTDVSANWRWCLAGAILTAVDIGLAAHHEKREQGSKAAMWLMLAGHFAFSLAAAMYLREATLTLVLAGQLISLAHVITRYTMDGLGWVVKGVLVLILTRLSLNPWLIHYPPETHWSLWTYGGSAFCCTLASRLLHQGKSLKKWLEGAGLHLLVLFFAAEIRYWLYDGQIFTREYTLTEASINTLLWSCLGLVYLYRSRISTFLTSYYRICSTLLLALAILNYGLILVVLNPLWTPEIVGQTPIWNLLLLSFGGPVVVALLYLFFHERAFANYAAGFGAMAFFIFVNMEIRHLWQSKMHLSLPISDGELYTYSIVWLALAVVTLLAAAKTSRRMVNRAGMALLLVVIAKIFLIDMSDLEGLLRVASFMGLGLSLLGLAFLYQKITQRD